jgi:hypothetical protein
MPGTIVAIGGGEIGTRETLPIDRAIIGLSNHKNPRLLFIPTASSDSEIYWKRIQKYFGDFLKCKTDVLLLIKEKPSREQMRNISGLQKETGCSGGADCSGWINSQLLQIHVEHLKLKALWRQ